ncbi:ankyrin repeat domain-containing protein [Spiroplasma endosymbiont of Eupeodes luniger]|uniref:ankyrin repeat domain-containing protein n=1 Tax=Spiroplasma endosymbiont of Eupeodes luniger TaxID=3066300 RepID=UPI0030CAD84B
MKMLIQQGVNVNTTNTMGSMPIHEATFVNNISAMQLLISEGANVNVINNIGAPLHIAIITGAITTATFLLRNRADINIRNNNLDTPLHLASMGKDFKMVKIVLENRANINVQDYCGLTPLHWAVYNSDVITTTILLEANANINIRGLNEATPFELGEYFNNFEIRNLLWEQANKNINKNDANICSVEKNIQQQQEVLFNHKRSYKQKIKVATDSRNSKRFKVNEISQRDLDEAGTSGVTKNSNTQINIQSEPSCPLPNLSEYTFIDEEMSEQNQNEKKNDDLIKQMLEDRERNDREREALL